MKYSTALLLLFTLFLSKACISSSSVVIGENDTFPTVTGTNLHGDEKTLPDCLEKDKTILVVAYQRWQQELCDQWYEKISSFMNENSDAAYFEIPTISKMNGFMRWFIYRGMRGGITDPEMRRQVITLHIDKKPFNKALQIETEETVHIFILDQKGKVLAREKGKFSQKKWDSLLSMMKENNNT